MARTPKTSKTAGDEHTGSSKNASSRVTKPPRATALSPSSTPTNTKRKHADTGNSLSKSAPGKHKKMKVRDAMTTGKTTSPLHNSLKHADGPTSTSATAASALKNRPDNRTEQEDNEEKEVGEEIEDGEEEKVVESEPMTTGAAAKTKGQRQGKRESRSNSYTVESILAVRRAADWTADAPSYQVAVKWEGYADPTWQRLETLANDRRILELLFSEQVTDQPGILGTRVCAIQPDDEQEGATAIGL